MCTVVRLVFLCGFLMDGQTNEPCFSPGGNWDRFEVDLENEWMTQVNLFQKVRAKQFYCPIS